MLLFFFNNIYFFLFFFSYVFIFIFLYIFFFLSKLDMIGGGFSTDGLLSEVFAISLGHAGNYVELCEHPELCRMFHVSCMVHLSQNALGHTRRDDRFLETAMTTLSKIPAAINSATNRGGFGARCPSYQPQV
jgi:hypothetical protein